MDIPYPTIFFVIIIIFVAKNYTLMITIFKENMKALKGTTSFRSILQGMSQRYNTLYFQLIEADWRICASVN